MIISENQQGTDEWLQDRVGIPTASVFDKIITTRGEESTQRKKLIYKLAGERILGCKDGDYTNAAMQRGIDLEPEARALFEMISDVEFKEVGLCYLDKRKDRGCSPDGINEELKEGLEIKCPELATHVEYLIRNELPAKYFQQVHGSLYITGFDKWHFFSYYPGMPPFHYIVERTEEVWIAKLGNALDVFTEELEETYNQIKA